MQVFIHRYTQTAIIKWCIQNLIWKLIFPHLTSESYGITDKGTLNVLEEQFTNLIGREHLVA